MKHSSYLIAFFISLWSCDKGNAIISDQKLPQKNIAISDTVKKPIQNINISGEWYYEDNSKENELLNSTFQLNIVVKDGLVTGSYCAIGKNGNKIDCSDENENNLSGQIVGDKIKLKFSSFFGGKNGEAEVKILSENSINWKITKEVEGGESYAPNNCNLTKKNNTSDLDGSYILKSCQSGRFVVKLIKDKQEYSYLVYDKNKIISKGLLGILKSEMPKEITLGKMGAVFYGDSIVIQNYGNLMNNYNNFMQCDKKYLSFIKKIKDDQKNI